MTKRPSRGPAPRINRAVVPTAIVSGLFAPLSMGAPGDLDPAFGDMGRTTWEAYFSGPAWSVQPLSADESLFAAGYYCDFYCYYAAYESGFIGQLSDSGGLSAQFHTDALGNREIHELALQSDGKVVAVGRELVGQVNELTIIRLNPDGSLDAGFADQGVFHQPSSSAAQAVTLDPSGAMAVAGSAQNNLLVVRLLANGTPDPAFGSAGVFNGPGNDLTGTDIVRTPAGEYRISVNSPATGACSVVGLTSAGQLDNSFGSAGIAAVGASGAGPASCVSMTAQADGSLLLAGQQGGHGFAARLLASGAADPGFAASQVPVAMQSATAVAVDANGHVLIAGTPPGGLAGALVMRLQASGGLDPLFGNAGSAWIDVPRSQAPVINDMKVLADGRVLAAGNALEAPLVVRLLGDAGAAGPGVIGVAATLAQVKQTDPTATVTVRRTGGAAGAVGVSYHSGGYTVGDIASAQAGVNYTAVSGQLNWADGDRTDRQITVQIIDHATGTVEPTERFVIALDGATGGAALGTGSGTVEILGGVGPPNPPPPAPNGGGGGGLDGLLLACLSLARWLRRGGR